MQFPETELILTPEKRVYHINLKAEDIADTAWYVANLPKHVCINDLVMTCVAQGNSMYLHKDA